MWVVQPLDQFVSNFDGDVPHAVDHGCFRVRMRHLVEAAPVAVVLVYHPTDESIPRALS